MTKTLFATAALLLLSATPAFAEEKPNEISFQRNGETYVYTKATLADGLVLTGRSLRTGDDFELTVRGNQVSGTMGGRFVSFKMPRPAARVATTELAAR